MFTGIIEAVGEIKYVAPLEKGKSLSITSGLLDLSDTKIGDSINITIGNKVYVYKVVNMSIVPADSTAFLAQDTDGSYVSIITCTPPGTTWKRLWIKAKLATS